MRRLFLVLTLGSTVCAAALRAQAPSTQTDSAFGALIARLSEAPGYFDTDNLISNEDSYLHVLGVISRVGARGGVYIGVGPDQNFSYIAAVRPEIAFIVDIRRDNLLQHLLLKSLFAMSRNRLEYLALLFGKTAPADTAGWGTRDVGALLDYIDHARADSLATATIRARVMARVQGLGVPLSKADVATIQRFHLTFIAQGPALRFNTLGRAPQSYYPDFRRLMTETNRAGRQSSYLAHEADFQFVRSLENRNLVVPVVGDFGGDKALAGIGQWMRTQHVTLSAFYTSNVEQYLMRDGSFDAFARNVARVPRSTSSIMIRSYFQGYHPQAVAGYHATQVAQLVDRFAALALAGALTDYYTLVTRDILDP